MRVLVTKRLKCIETVINKWVVLPTALKNNLVKCTAVLLDDVWVFEVSPH